MNALEARIQRRKQTQETTFGNGQKEKEENPGTFPYREWNPSDFLGKCMNFIFYWKM